MRGPSPEVTASIRLDRIVVAFEKLVNHFVDQGGNTPKDEELCSNCLACGSKGLTKRTTISCDSCGFGDAQGLKFKAANDREKD